VLYRSLAPGRREVKFAELRDIALGDTGWAGGFSDWREPFLARSAGAWSAFPALEELFIYNGSGIMPGRTWVIAPDQKSLAERWEALKKEADPVKKERLFHPQLRKGKVADRHIQKVVEQSMGSAPARPTKIADEAGPMAAAIRYPFRTFDRQWIIGDARLINYIRPVLWSGYSDRQVYLTALQAYSPTSGPAVSFCASVPDLDHYKGSFGGRAFPLWQDAAGKSPNMKPAFLAFLSKAYGRVASAEDAMAYIASLLAHPDFTTRFAEDLQQPGLRVPVTKDAKLFAEAVSLGREAIWLHCYGERMANPADGRPAGAPRLPATERPTIPKGGEIPGAPEPLPDTMTYDAAKRRLHVGKGYVDNVPQAVWDYEVSGKKILRQWFSYRKRDRSRPLIGDKRPPSPLDGIQPDHWLPEYTTDLINLLNVLGFLVKLEPKQKDLLDRILAGPLLDRDALVTADALAGPPKVKGAKKGATSDQPTLL
jgi:hypothetical protein